MATYATLAEFLAYLRLDAADPESDWYQVCLNAATEAVDLAMGTTGAQLDPVPAMVELATLIQAARWAKRRDSPYGIAGSPDMGSELRLLSKLDPDVAVLVSGYGELDRAGGTT